MFDTDVFNEKWNGSFACVLFVSMSVPLSQWKNDGVKNRSPEITWKLVSHLTHVTCDAIIFRFLWFSLMTTRLLKQLMLHASYSSSILVKRVFIPLREAVQSTWWQMLQLWSMQINSVLLYPHDVSALVQEHLSVPPSSQGPLPWEATTIDWSNVDANNDLDSTRLCRKYSCGKIVCVKNTYILQFPNRHHCKQKNISTGIFPESKSRHHCIKTSSLNTDDVSHGIQLRGPTSMTRNAFTSLCCSSPVSCQVNRSAPADGSETRNPEVK